MSLEHKYRTLQQLLSKLDTAAVAFSGGVDSTLLLQVARDILGRDKVLALTIDSPVFPRFETDQCSLLAQKIGVRHQLIQGASLELPEFTRNDPQRCYYCKRDLFSTMQKLACEQGFPVLLEGSNLDDLDDYRPGRKALEELGIGSPLLEAQLTKDDVRRLSKQLNLPTWDKQSFACLATRFPYGTEIDAEGLARVDACEAWLRQQGFDNYRVRIHGQLARIEINPARMDKLLDPQLRQQLVEHFKQNGFDYVTLDLQGYRSGSMNETLPEL